MNILRMIIKILSFLLAVPFVTYGFLGLIKYLSLEHWIDKYLGLVGNYHNPVTALILVVIGFCLIYGLNALANKLR